MSVIKLSAENIDLSLKRILTALVQDQAGPQATPLIADDASLRTQLTAAVADLTALYTSVNAAVADLATLKTKVNALIDKLLSANIDGVATGDKVGNLTAADATAQTAVAPDAATATTPNSGTVVA